MFYVGCFPPLPLGEGRGEGGIAPRLSSTPNVWVIAGGFTASAAMSSPGAGGCEGEWRNSPSHVHRALNMQGKSIYE
jgi:hypothetical protein